MKIWVHRYQLIPRVKGLKSRAGALVKAEWTVGQSVGYSDLHPWPEFGEPELGVHLDSLASVQLTALAENSLEFNYIDREYRMNKKNAFTGLIPPRSHRLVLDVMELDAQKLHAIKTAGFSHIKIKMGRDLKAETQNLVMLAMSTNLMWRIDFNGKLTESVFLEWWKALDGAVKSRIDMIEDPVPESSQLKLSGPWANDWVDQKTAMFRVLKPAREGIEELTRYNRVIFTHGMDHTLGQACAAWAAARFYSAHPKKVDVCGLAPPDIYEPDDFMRAWGEDGPRLRPTPGLGFGFDLILDKLKWEKIL